MTIERTQDYRRVKRLLDTNPSEGETYADLIISHKVFYLIEVKNENDVGVWFFVPMDNGVYEMHGTMSSACRGKDAVDSGLDAIRWIYENTDADNIIAPVPIHLKHAQRIPRAAGLVYEGIKGDFKAYTMNRDLFNELEGTM